MKLPDCYPFNRKIPNRHTLKSWLSFNAFVLTCSLGFIITGLIVENDGAFLIGFGIFIGIMGFALSVAPD